MKCGVVTLPVPIGTFWKLQNGADNKRCLPVCFHKFFLLSTHPLCAGC